jgi:hypothetical protein
MKAYGWPQFCWRDEDYGPPSKHCSGLSSGKRRKARRVLHRKGRSEGRREIKTQLKEIE